MKAIKLLVAGACALGLFASALADGETGKATWFAEDASTVSAALRGGGTTPYGTWSNLADQVQVKESVVEVDADDAQAVAYTPTAGLEANASSVTLSNVVFSAARKALPAIEDDTQAAVTVTTNEAGNCVFAVVSAGEWVLTGTLADPTAEYTIRCDFTYGEPATVSYFIVNGDTETPLLEKPAANSAAAKVSTVKLAGCGSFTAVDGAYPVATIDFGVLPEGVAKVTVNGDELVDGKATVAKGAAATIAITAADGWSVDPTTITLDSVTEDVNYKGNFPATVTKLDGWLVVTADGTETNGFEKLSAALDALEDGDTLMPEVPGESDLSVRPMTFTKENLKAVPVDCPFIVTNNDVTVDFRGRVIKDAIAPAVVPEEADGRPYLVMVTEGATNVTIRNGFLFGSGYDVSSSEPKDSDRRLIGVKHAEAEVENCVMFGPGVSGILRVGQDASLVVRNSWFDGQGDGCQDVVLVSGGSELVFANVKGFWNPEDFWGTEDGVNGSFTEITGEQFAIVDGSTLTLNCTVISNNFTQWIKPEDLKTSAVVARGEGNKLDLDGTSEVWMGGGVPAVSADGELVIDGAGKVTGDVDGEDVVFTGCSYTFNPENRVADGYIAIPDGYRWTVVPATRWMVVSEAGTSVYSTLSDALAALNDGDTLMPEAPGDGTISETHPTAFDKGNLRPVSVDCPFVITKNNVTVNFRGRVLRDAVAVADEKPYLIWVEGATGVKIQNGFFFGTTWRADYELSQTDYRGFRISNGSSVSVEGCAVFIAAVENSVNVLDGAFLAFSGCWIDGQGDGAERVFHAADDSTITIKDTKGLWNPDNFWGITDGVVASLPAITGEQFTLEASSLYLDNTIISNTVTHWSEGGKVATPVTFIGEPNALSMANGAFITAKDDKGIVLPKIALMWGDTSVETAVRFMCSGESPEIVSDPGNLAVTEEELSGGGYRYVVKPQTFTAGQIGVCSWTWHASISNILEQMEKGGYTGIQLALAPWLGIEEGSLLFGGEEGEAAWKLVKDSIKAGKLNVMSTMINFPGEDYSSLIAISNTQGYTSGILTGTVEQAEAIWKSNLFYTVEAAKLTQELGVKYLTTEIGFIEIAPDTMFERIKEICESCMVYNVTFLMESGPQTANGMSTLLKRLNDAGITNVGVNYDPGDDELFGSEGAVTSFDAMWPWIMQCHIKDCKSERDYWNQDCPWGEGYVSKMPFSSGKDFLSHLRRLGWNGGILFEYMAGEPTLTPDRAAKIQDAMLTILRSNNQDDKDPTWSDSKWVRPSVMMGEDDKDRVRAAMKAQGFDAESANIVATTDNAYLTLKNWAENTVKNPAPEALARANGAVLTSAALGSEKVLTSDDVAVTAMEVGAEGATTLTVKLGEGGYGSGAWNPELLRKAFGVLGTYSLGEAFSAENVFVSHVSIDGMTGTATATVEPKPVKAAAPQTFFFKARVK